MVIITKTKTQLSTNQFHQINLRFQEKMPIGCGCFPRSSRKAGSLPRMPSITGNNNFTFISYLMSILVNSWANWCVNFGGNCLVWISFNEQEVNDWIPMRILLLVFNSCSSNLDMVHFPWATRYGKFQVQTLKLTWMMSLWQLQWFHLYPFSIFLR